MQKPRIMVVEDEWIIANDIRSSLKKSGYGTVPGADTAEGAVKKAASGKPDLIIMDIVLKGKTDGIKAAKTIIARFNIPVIFLTAYADKTILERVRKTGAHGYLVKPFNDRELHAAIELALYKHDMEIRLKESENRLFTTLRSINDAVISTDRKGFITFMNPVAQSLTGWNLKDVDRKSLKDVFIIKKHSTGNKVMSLMKEFINKKHPVSQARYSLQRKDKSNVNIELSSAPIINDKGEANGAVMVFRDITERMHAENKLEQIAIERTAKLKLFSDIAEKSPDGVQILDVDGYIIYSNKAIQKIYGYTQQYLKGRHINELNSDPEIAQKDIIPSIKKTGRWNGELMVKHKGGRSFPVWLAAFIVNDEKGRPMGMIGIIRDLTERRRIEEDLRKFKFISDNSYDAHFLLGRDAKFQYVNKAACRLMGYTEKALLNLRVPDVDVLYDLEKFQELFDVIQQHTVSPIESINKRKDGTDFPSEITVTGYKIDGIPYMFAALRDITERKLTEEKLKKHHDKLEEQVKERTHEILEVNENLQREIYERKRVEEALISSQERLEAIKQIGTMASSSLDLGEVLEVILKSTLETAGASSGIILLKDPEGGYLSLGASIGLSASFVNSYKKQPIQTGKGLTGRIFQNGIPIYIPEDMSHDQRVTRSAIKKEGLNSFIGVPIYAADEPIGVMNIMTRSPDLLNENDIHLVSAIGAQVGYAIRNAQLYEDRKIIEKQLLDYQKQLRSLSSQISLIEEHEKRRIATELHDCIGQTLALSKIKLGLLNKTASSPELKNIIREILQLIEQTIKETRTLTFELSPPILYELGLSQAVKWLIDQFREKHGLKIYLQDDGNDKPFDNNTRFFLFQAIRELLFNVVKHAHAAEAKVSMSSNNNKLHIIIEDDGTGFTMPSSYQGGYGLFNIRERMNHINGQFEIKSLPGRGTRVSLVAPYNPRTNKYKKESA